MRLSGAAIRVRLEGLAAAAFALIVALASPAWAQVNDLSGSGGLVGSRIDEALQRAAGAEVNSRFYIILRFDGLVPSDAEAGSGGTLMINRYDGWMMSGFSGLAPSRNVWDQLESGERLLDLATMQMTDPGPQPVLEPRPLLAVVRGRVVAREQTRIEDVSLRFPSGAIRLRERPVYWLGEASASELVEWIRSQLGSLDADRDRGVRRDLVGLLSVQPQGGDVLDTLEQSATRDTDGNVRRAAISYLGRRPEDTVRHLTMILSGADDPDDRAVALEALANRTGPAGLDRLIAAARDGNEAEKIRAVAISFLGDIDDPRATDALETIFDSSDPEPLRRRALRELAERKTGDGYIVNWLAGIAHSDPSLEIRKEAVRLLGRTNNPEARKVLEELLRIGRL